MRMAKKLMLLGTYAAVLLLVVSTSYFLSPAEEPAEDTDIVGTWNLISREAIGSHGYDRTVDQKFSLEVTEKYGNIFTATSQGVAFTGVRVGDNVVFEYRYGNTAWITADGRISSDGILTTYETHYYTEDYWFISVSKYSKTDEPPNTAHITPKQGQSSWTLREGNSHNYDGMAKSYPLKGANLLIRMPEGNLFKAEMQQQVNDADGNAVVTTRLMSGAFVDDTDDVITAFLIDESGKIWVLTIQNGLATLRTIVISEYYSPEKTLVVTERAYFNGIKPSVPTPPNMKGTWTANGAAGRWSDGSNASQSGTIETIYREQTGYVFIGETPAASLPEVGYLVYSPHAYNGWIVHVGTDLGGGDYKTGCAFLNGNEMIMVEFTWDDVKKVNGVMVYEFKKIA